MMSRLRRIQWVLALLGSMVAGPPFARVAVSDCVGSHGVGDCFPDPGHELSAPEAFAAGAIPVDQVRIGNTTVGNGTVRSALVRKLGSGFRVVEPEVHRDCDQNARYFCDWIHRLGSMLYYYQLADLMKEEGRFEVVEWEIPGAGTLQAILSSRHESEPLRARLYLFTAPQAPRDSVRSDRGNPNVYRRSGPRPMVWNADTGRLAIAP